MCDTENDLCWGWLGLVCETKLGPETHKLCTKKNLLIFLRLPPPSLSLDPILEHHTMTRLQSTQLNPPQVYTE